MNGQPCDLPVIRLSLMSAVMYPIEEGRLHYTWIRIPDPDQWEGLAVVAVPGEEIIIEHDGRRHIAIVSGLDPDRSVITVII